MTQDQNNAERLSFIVDASRLLFNHVDAWGGALIVASLAMLLHDAFSLYGVLLVLAIALCYWLGFALNDYFDRHYDARDPDKAQRNFFVQHSITGSQVRAGTVMLLGLIFLVFADGGVIGIILFMVGIGAMLAYSAPPLRLKNVPIADLLMHLIFVETFPYLSVLLLLELRLTALDITLLIFLALASLTTQLEQQLRDYPVDRLHERNFTVRYGQSVSWWLVRGLTVFILCLLCVQTLRGIFPPVLFPFALIGVPLFWYRLQGKAVQARARNPVLWMTAGGLLYTGCLYLLALFS